MFPIILASASPRRKELLTQVGISFSVRISSCEEIITTVKSSDIVMELSFEKASDVASSLSPEEKENCCIIGADTIVALDQQILGKPKDKKEAFHMLRTLSNSCHQVYTGVTLIRFENGIARKKTFFEKTDVYFYELTNEEILNYIATGDPLDKAGAYGIQGRAAAFVEKIHGDYNNVVGLPVARLLQELKTL